MTDKTQALLPVTPELLPCPFCDGEAKWIEDPGVCGVPFGLVVDHQPSCFFGLFASITDAEQIARWNTRGQSSGKAGGVDVEQAAWDWLSGKFLNIEAGHDPADRDYSSDEMVDAFIAGRAQSHSLPGDVGTVEAKALLGEPVRHHVRGGSAATYCVPYGTALAAVDTFREALKPFAEVADCYHDSEADNFEVWADAGPEHIIRASFKLAHYRKARAALAALTPSALSGDAGGRELAAALRKYSRSEILTSDLRRVLSDAADALGAK